jgi:hypothetical protein
VCPWKPKSSLDVGERKFRTIKMRKCSFLPVSPYRIVSLFSYTLWLWCSRNNWAHIWILHLSFSIPMWSLQVKWRILFCFWGENCPWRCLVNGGSRCFSHFATSHEKPKGCNFAHFVSQCLVLNCKWHLLFLKVSNISGFSWHVTKEAPWHFLHFLHGWKQSEPSILLDSIIKLKDSESFKIMYISNTLRK